MEWEHENYIFPLYQCNGVAFSDFEEVVPQDVAFLNETPKYFRNDFYPQGYFGLTLSTFYTYLRIQQATQGKGSELFRNANRVMQIGIMENASMSDLDKVAKMEMKYIDEEDDLETNNELHTMNSQCRQSLSPAETLYKIAIRSVQELINCL